MDSFFQFHINSAWPELKKKPF
jgi:hypothetical protein